MEVLSKSLVLIFLPYYLSPERSITLDPVLLEGGEMEESLLGGPNASKNEVGMEAVLISQGGRKRQLSPLRLKSLCSVESLSYK